MKFVALPAGYALVALTIVAALIAIPVRCDAISLPHSLFLTPGAVANADQVAHSGMSDAPDDHHSEHESHESPGDVDAQSLKQVGSSNDAPVQVTQPRMSDQAIDEQQVPRPPVGDEVLLQGRVTPPDIPPPRFT